MKTTSLKHSKKNNTIIQSKSALVVFICIVILAIQLFFPNTLFRIIYSVSLPFITTRDYIGNKLFSIESYFTSKSFLANDNASLRKDLQTANVALLSMQELEKQNQSLENMVGTKKSSNVSISKTVFASVTTKPPFSPYDYLIINTGSNSGIEINNPVFADDGTPIGIIGAVYPSSSKVLLFSNGGEKLEVVIGDKKFEATAIGAGGGNFHVKIPTVDMPKKGDAVYIPQFAPQALGIIDNVYASPTDAFASVIFAFPENIFEISYVTVDTGNHFQVDNNSNEATSTNQ